MTTAILVLTVLNTVGIGALVLNQLNFVAEIEVERDAPADDELTLNSDTNGLA